MMMFSKWVGASVLACVLALAGCAPKAGDNANTAARQYPMRGEIKGLDKDQHVATIKHEDIPGFMSAMTMGYPVKDEAEFSRLTVGKVINATVYVKGDEMWVGNIQQAK